jgi:glycosyltransferase involved in cell wall biosynthesis
MRILHIVSTVDPAFGGPLEAVRQLGSVSRSDGHHVEVASLDAPDAPHLTGFPVPVHALGPGILYYGFSPRFVPWLRENARNYDAVIVNGLWQYHSFGAWRALRRSSTPYFVFTHGGLAPWLKRTYPLKHLKKWMYWPWGQYPVLRDARAVLFTCEEERVLARQSFWLYSCNEVVVTLGAAGPTGDSEAQARAFYERFPHLRKKRLALFMGRLHPVKGCDLLIEAFAKVLARDPDWHLVMAGPDTVGLQAKLSSVAEQLRVADRITWAGLTRGDVKWGAFRASEIFVLPSHQENFGMVVAEALACGVPVLISDKVNIWREIERDGAGLVSPDDLPGTMNLLLRWSQMAEAEKSAMRQCAKECFLNRFEIQKVGSALINAISAN